MTPLHFGLTLVFFIAVTTAVEGGGRCPLYCAMDSKAICALSPLKGYKTFLDKCSLDKENYCNLGDYSPAHPGECTTQELILICNREFCLKELPPVCAVSPTRGRLIFPNECFLNSENTCNKGDFVVSSSGECKTPEPGLICTPNFCPASGQGICGLSPTKGYRTFPNDCLLNAENTCNHGDYKAAHAGDCTKRELGLICTYQFCKSSLPPVCGVSPTRGFYTFPTECFLNAENTCNNGDFTWVHDGRCSTLEVEGKCPLVCPAVYSPLCGFSPTFGYKTFSNTCAFDNENGCKNGDYSFLHDGECTDKEIEKNCLRNCSQFVFRPICGFSPTKSYKTFNNKCLFILENSCYGGDYIIDHRGVCKVPDEPDCDIICTAEYNPVCGFSVSQKTFKTFGSRCQWEAANLCKYNDDYLLAHGGACRPEEIDNNCKRRCTHDKSGEVCSYSSTTGYQTIDSMCQLLLNITCYGADFILAHEGKCKCLEGPVPGCPVVCPKTSPYTTECGFSLSRKRFKTFSSKCQLEADNKCQYDNDYILVHSGDCSKEECGNKCTRSCSDKYEPVCTLSPTKGYKTVDNICIFLLNITCNGVDSVLAHTGVCTKEELGKCNRNCSALTYWPVCGLDPVRGYNTFPSLCDLEVADKCDYADYSLVHEGKCSPKELGGACNHLCPLYFVGVCGFSHIKGYKTFANLCFMDRENTCTLSDYSLAHTGKCTPQEIGEKCNRVCHLIYSPVCGKSSTKGYKTFPNFCLLDRENGCYLGDYNVVHEGECYPWEICVNCG